MVVANRRPSTRRVERVPQVRVPEPANGLDCVVNALVMAWNNQARDPDARVFFGTPIAGERQGIIARSVYRWPEAVDQQFVARWLAELARAVQGGTFRWNS